MVVHNKETPKASRPTSLQLSPLLHIWIKSNQCPVESRPSLCGFYSGAALGFLEGSHTVDVARGEAALLAAACFSELVALYRINGNVRTLLLELYYGTVL